MTSLKPERSPWVSRAGWFWQRNVVRICILLALLGLTGALLAAQHDNHTTRVAVERINVRLCRQQLEDRENVRNLVDLALAAQATSGKGVSRELLTVAEGIHRAWSTPPAVCSGLSGVVYSNPPLQLP